jgi:hypothetical protein
MLLEFTPILSPFPPILRTLAITWPQNVLDAENSLAEAAQVNGGVIHYLQALTQ